MDEPPPDEPESSQPKLSTILNDASSLLLLLDAAANKLALVLNPSKPAYKASLPLLHDIAKHTSALLHCITLVRPEQHGSTLRLHFARHIKNVIDALRQLLHIFLDHAAGRTPAQSYLIQTDTLHGLVEIARAKSGIQRTNLAAVRTAWRDDHESLKDCVEEVEGMISKSDRRDAGEDDDEDFDDGWDEVMGDLDMSDSKLDDQGVHRATNVRDILRSSVSIHEQVLSRFLILPPSSVPTSSKSPRPRPPNSALDALYPSSDALLVASDDLASTLYAPHQPPAMLTQLDEFTSVVRTLQTRLQPFVAPTPSADDLAQKLGEMQVSDDAQRKDRESARKDFETRFSDLFKRADEFRSSLQQELEVG
ncbi:hypothetical protein CONPUDRAFT_162446 [Coniophora puteana RWD-64-598 SS2]|uniref:Uncharacterized protein n=1 Tax=Coniophora puteana (strain RWD-64-598) TaxID=741705 RepID=A0A5M3N2Q1_CONPW|nr:uncharacterized protein CONPUDRAFT_162446 [Coniophora puteana RWD-64-598 SS2]EIW85191.1 hypothetical protein CONPUDRAFT_162446 [Coniophora puteana RWD-64-598 SS2]